MSNSFTNTTGPAYKSIKSKVEANMISNLIPMVVSYLRGTTGVHSSIASMPSPTSTASIFAALRDSLGGGVVAGALPSTFTGDVGGFEEEQAVSEYYSSLMDMLRYPIILKLKTVPMFSISSPRVLFKRVVVLINTNSGMNPYISSNDPWNRVLSGVYYILGFKHVVSATQTYSQFLLIREPFNFASYIFAEYGSDSPAPDDFSVASMLDKGSPGWASM